MDMLAAYAACRPLYSKACETLPPAHAMRVTAYAVTYRFMFDHLGRHPKRAEHAEALDVSESQYDRYRRYFRDAFGVSSPMDLPAELVPSVPTLSLGITYATA